MKRIVSIAMLLAMSTATYAQERNYTLTVTPAQLGMIGTALGELPYNKAAPLINAITEQVNAQSRVPDPLKPVETPQKETK